VHAAVFEAAAVGDAREEPEALVRLTHRTIKGVTEDLERFRFNTAISKLQVLSNAVRDALDASGGARAAARALAQLLAPFAPFEAEELWRTAFGEQASVHTSSWPTYDPALATEASVTLVVQVDGKVRDRIDVAPDVAGDAARELAMKTEGARRALGDREVVSVIVRPPKLVNIVTTRS
jgi:leucyl-tRNA synthetase